MAIIDNGIGGFANGQSLSGATSTNSTNVYNAGSAKKLFAGRGDLQIQVIVSAVGGTSPTFRAQFVGADDAGLSSNVEVIDDTGVSKALVAGDLPWVKVLRAGTQQVAKQYYGVIFTQSGTSPTATVSANAVLNAQTNLVK